MSDHEYETKVSEDALKPMSDELIINSAIIRMNNTLKEQGFNERERSFMWGMTVNEMEEFLTKVWENIRNDKKAEQDAQIDQLHGPEAAAALEAAIADGSVFSESSRDPEEKPKPTPKPPKSAQPVKSVQTEQNKDG